MRFEKFNRLVNGFAISVRRGYRKLTSPSYVRVGGLSRAAGNGARFDYYPEMVANDYY